MSADLDIVVVSYNTRADLVACLTSVFVNPSHRLRDVFVVDNASSDGSAEAVRAEWPAVRLMALKSNVGFAAANNIAIRESTAPFVLLLNSDTVVPVGAIDALLARLETTGAVAAGPRLVDASGHPEISFGPMLSPWAEMTQRLRVRLAQRDDKASRQRVATLVSKEQQVDWVSGACLLVRRQAAVDAGLLDERYFMYEEDVDFCAALRAGGGSVLFTPAAEVIHLRGRSTAKAGAARHAMYDRSHLAFYEKHHPRWVPLLRVWMRLRGRGRQA